MDFSKLKEPFRAEDIEWRLQQCGEKKDGGFWGKCLAYITSRAVQERLDEVCGADGWRSEIRKDGNAYLCTLSIRIKHDDGSVEWISRTDGADATDIESVKGGISGALKRAAVQFGIGRYLYDLEEGWAIISESGKYFGKTKTNKEFRWNPPALPEWALPKGDEKDAPKRKSAVKNSADSAKGDKPETVGSKFDGNESVSPAEGNQENADIKSISGAIIKRIGLVMKREENGRSVFTEAEIDNVRNIIANTRLTPDGIKELEKLEEVVQEELDSRLGKKAGEVKAA